MFLRDCYHKHDVNCKIPILLHISLHLFLPIGKLISYNYYHWLLSDTCYFFTGGSKNKYGAGCVLYELATRNEMEVKVEFTSTFTSKSLVIKEIVKYVEDHFKNSLRVTYLTDNWSSFRNLAKTSILNIMNRENDISPASRWIYVYTSLEWSV